MAASPTDLLAANDATGLAELVRSGEVHPRELVEAAIGAVEALDGALNALVHRQFDRARREAQGLLPDGPFTGVPFLFKDYKGREAGEPYCAGMAALKAQGYRPTTDSAVALAFRAAGLIPIGRTNVPELALMGTTEPEAFGPTHNPWDLTRSPGGSSGGSAAAVAAGIVPAAHANDIAGSIRIPAAMCGVVGLKPTKGRVLTSEAADPPVGMFVEGAVTRSVRDAAGLLDVLTDRSGLGPWPVPRPVRPFAAEVGAPPGRLRVGLTVAAFNGAEVDPACAAAAGEVATLLEGLGHIVDADAAPAALHDPVVFELSRTVLAVHNALELDRWTPRLGRALGEDDVEPVTWQMVVAGRAVPAPVFLDALVQLQACSREIVSWWAGPDRSGYDLLVTPATAEGPTVLGDYVAAYRSGRGSAFTRPFNVTGQPAIVLPLGWPADGLPRGVQLVAAPGREDLLVRVGSQLEAAAPWAQRRPPVHVGGIAGGSTVTP